MTKDTYESNDILTSLEYYEWDDTWRIKAHDLKMDRLLLIGDSISRGYRNAVAELFKDTLLVDNYATSKAIDNPSLIKTIDVVMEQEPNCKIIHFNSGLHGWHLDDETEYKNHLDNTIKYIKEKYPDVLIVIGLSTPLRILNDIEKVNEERTTRVIKRNISARAVAQKYNLPVTDLFSPVEHSSELYTFDGVHLTDEGYLVLAKKIHEICTNLAAKSK